MRPDDGIGGLLAEHDRQTRYVEGLPAVATAAIDAVALELDEPPTPPPRRARRGSPQRDAVAILEREFGRRPGKPLPPGWPRSSTVWTGTHGSAGVLVQVNEEHRGRVTGHGVACAEHGAFPVLAPCLRDAIVIAGRHVESEHEGKGRVRLGRGDR